MKNHEEIHDAITARSQLPHAADLDSIWDILHAMNDRIETLEQKQTASDKDMLTMIESLSARIKSLVFAGSEITK